MDQEPVKNDTELLSEAGDAAFDRLNPDGVKTGEPVKPAEKKTETPAPPPSDKDVNDKDAWMKGLDEKTLTDLKDGKLIPKHRFDEVLERTKAYETLGTPEDIQRRMTDLSKKIEDTPKGKEPELTAEEKETQAFISKLFPQLQTYSEMQKQLEDMKAQLANSQKTFREKEELETAQRQKQHQELLSQGREKIKSFAKELGLNENDPQILDELEGDITGRLHRDEKLRVKFYEDGDVQVLDEVFKGYKSRFFSGVQRKTEADILKGKASQNKSPKPPIQGGPAAHKEKSVEEMDWNEVGDRAVSRIG